MSQVVRQCGTIQVWNRLTSVVQRCSNLRQLQPIHAVFIVTGLTLSSNATLSGSGDDMIRHAPLVLGQADTTSSFAFNAIVRGYSRSSDPRSALRLVKLMIQSASDGVVDHCTFNFLLLACVNGGLALEGRMFHCWVVKNGLAFLDCHVQTALIRFYVACKAMDNARKLFDEIPQRDVFHWNSLIDGYVRCGSASEAVNSFQDMLTFGFEPDEHCATTAIKACTHLGALSRGKRMHEYVKSKGFESCTFVATALVDMYAKCGCLEMATQVFEKMTKRNAFSWAALIGAFAVHGQAARAMHCLERMQLDDGLKPDAVVLLGVLTACAHTGLIKEGRLLFDNMEARYGVSPQHEHYSCVVDLLCRAGRLGEAYEIVRKMPMKPMASVWHALLSGCRARGRVDLAELAVEELELLKNDDEAGHGGVYAQMSNIYLAARRSEDAVRVRKMIGDCGAGKTPGWSMIEVDGEVNRFVSGDGSHKHRSQIGTMLDLVFFDLIRGRPIEFSEDINLYLYS